jgi:predicted  nucleic acid-binding Zn-ribbon protein
MVGHCTNCGQKDVLMIFRQGDKATNLDCPTCGVRGPMSFEGVHPDRLATPDEIPAAEPFPQ